MGNADASDVVRRGYDAVSLRYRADDAPAGQYAPWIADLHPRLPPSARVLDVGCGCGVSVARDLTADCAAHNDMVRCVVLPP